ncbi:MAG: hypothetical protein RLZ04_781, partial [Actinomycetota bacterium]
MADPRSLLAAAVRRARRTRASRSSAARNASPRREWCVAPPSGATEGWWAAERGRVAAALDAVIPPLDVAAFPAAAVVCVTNRPEQAEHVCSTILRQVGVGPLRVVIVLNDVQGD